MLPGGYQITNLLITELLTWFIWLPVVTDSFIDNNCQSLEYLFSLLRALWRRILVAQLLVLVVYALLSTFPSIELIYIRHHPLCQYLTTELCLSISSIVELYNERNSKFHIVYFSPSAPLHTTSYKYYNPILCTLNVY